MDKEQVLEFGTAGIRGILGSGQNRLNTAHLMQIVEGFAKYLKNKFTSLKEIKVVVGRDNRRMSNYFAYIACNILEESGIKVIFSKDITPTPFVSYLVISQKAQGAINITASHNPPEYNGIKLYNEFGGQCLPDEIKSISSFFKEYKTYNEYSNYDKLQENFDTSQMKSLNFKEEFEDEYIEKIFKVGGKVDIKNIKIAYSPLHGTGGKFAQKIFNKFGLKPNKTIFLEEKQMVVDKDFSYCKTPNPEKISAYELIIKKAKENDCDAFLITDPDSDRVGFGIITKKENNDATVNIFTGNETATLIFNFLLEINKKDALKNKYLVNSFVSSSLPSLMAKENDIESIIVPTGFKWISMIINKTINKKLLFAFEESYGSLLDEDIARDKDALQSIVILIKMLQYYKNQNLNLHEVLENIYKKYGYVISETLSVNIAKNDVNRYLEEFKNLDFEGKMIEDFNKYDNFLKSNMLKISFKNDSSWIASRPSGTEPLIKFYFFVHDQNLEQATKKFKLFKSKIEQLF